MPLRTTTSGVSVASRKEVSDIFAEAKKIYAPGGGYMAGTEAAIARGSKRSIASGVQQLASVGLAGTSIIGGLGKKYEEEIGMPTRARATTARLGALAGLLQAEAGATASLATRYTTTPYTPYGGGGGATSIPSVAPRTAQPRTVAQPQQQRPQQQPPLPTLNFPKTFAPAGQWQGTIGGTSFYSTGTGRISQTVSAPKKRPISNYYDVGGELGI